MLMNNSITSGITLAQLLEGLAVVGPDLNCDVLSISNDSRSIHPGGCFIAYPGDLVDGRAYIKDAIDGQIGIVIYDNTSVLPNEVIRILKEGEQNVAAIPLSECQQRLGILGARFYGFPSQQMFGIGVTGTNGKSTVAYLIASAYEALHRSCGLIGTLGVGFPKTLKPSPLTTLDALAMQKELSKLNQQGAEAFVYEASSHGLSQSRLNGVSTDIGILTNIKMDHADYHGSRTEYIAAKERLFAMARRHIVMNFDDPVSTHCISVRDPSVGVVGYSMKCKHKEWDTLVASDVICTIEGVDFSIDSPYGKMKVHSPLVGRFQVENLLAAISALLVAGIDFEPAVRAVSGVESVPGRMQVFGGGDLPHVVVDYAHSEHSLEAALVSLRPFCAQQLWCVFGCGGQRDAARRSGMGNVAERYSDQIVITDDNPRDEDPEVITKAIIDSLLCPWAATVEHDRSAAIAYAIQNGQAGDVILIAGKGHELSQIVKGESLWHSDLEQVLSQLSIKDRK